MSNGKIEMVYAKQALLKPAKNFRYLWRKAQAVVRPAAPAAPESGNEAPAPRAPSSCWSLSPGCLTYARVNTHVIAPYAIQSERSSLFSILVIDVIF